jgi:hypothetical protein
MVNPSQNQIISVAVESEAEHQDGQPSQNHGIGMVRVSESEHS